MKITFTLIFLSLTINIFAQFKIVTIDNRTYGPNEPSIYINPVNPSYIVAGSNIRNLYVSNDTGKTWELKQLFSSLGVYGDPVIYADEYGNFYFCHLAATASKKYPHWIDRIIVQKSDNNGQTFSDGSYAGHNGDKEQDKHWIVKDQHSLLHKDNIYLSWTEFDKYESTEPDDHSRIRFARSVDGAATFEQAITISDTIGDCLDGDLTLEGATPAIGKDGEVCVAWAAYNKIYFDISKDGGITWGKDRVIATQEDGWSLDFGHIFRSNGLPFLVADHSGKKYNNRLYLTWGESQPIIGGEIKLIYSDDNGESWSNEITVNSSSLGDQFLPHIAVDQTDGTVYIVFYDRRNSPSNVLMDVYVAFSEDGGKTFINKLITPQPFSPPGNLVFFGDYNGISADRGIVRPIWTGVDFNLPTKLMIQTALLTKDNLKNKNQVIKDTLFYDYFYNKDNSQFILYSSKGVKYSIKLKVKKHKYSLFSKSYKRSGMIKLNGKNHEVSITAIRGYKPKLKMQLSGKDFYLKMNSFSPIQMDGVD